jgi:hypothetical protein
MQRRLPGILLGLAIALCALPGVINAAVSSHSRSVEAKVTLEASLERRLQTVLQKVLGTSDIVVIVNAQLQTEFGDDELMPGVPLKSTPSDPAQIQSRTLIKNISAVIIVDEDSSEKDIALARKTAEGVLGIDAKRGDKIQVDKMPLRRAAEGSPTGTGATAKAPRWTFDTIVSILWLVTAAIGLVMLYGAFLKPMLLVARKVAASAAAPPPSPIQAPQLPEGLDSPIVQDKPAHTNGHSETNGHSKEDLPFSFVSERNLPMLSFLLKRQTPRVCAVVCHYLPARMAAELLIGMKTEKRGEVVQQMSRVTQLEGSQVQAIEANVKGKIDYLMGGEDKLADILEQVPVQMQEELLGAVQEKDPDVGRRLGRRIVMLEDIALLDADDLKALSRRVKLQTLAAVLKEQTALRERLMPKLTTGLGQWLSQEIELVQHLSPEQLAQEQRKVLSALSVLVREGKIVLNKEEGSDAPAANQEPETALPEPAFAEPQAIDAAPIPEPTFETAQPAPEPDFPTSAPPEPESITPEVEAPAVKPENLAAEAPPEPPMGDKPEPRPTLRPPRPPRPSMGDWTPKPPGDSPKPPARPRPVRPKFNRPEDKA